MTLFRTRIILLLLALTTSAAIGQVSFSDQTFLLSDPSFTSGVAIGVADMNGDGLDDILRLNDGSLLSIEFQTADGQPFGNFNYGSVNGSSWAIVAGDLNNDGTCDIMTGGGYNNVKVLMGTANGAGFQLQTLPSSNIFVQGSNMADINNDGWLDIFACHDDGPSRLWLNDGTGSFPAEAGNSVINFDITPGSGQSNDDSGNYGSVWTDFDNDRDLDLYIAKCRIGVSDPEDTRRINILFVNDGNGNYEERGEEFGLRIKHQSWTADFGDIDNDGDLDCFVTNHDHTLQLLENDGSGHFTDISAAAGLASLGIENYNQGIMRDFDNDGFLDLITAQPAHYFHNNGNKTFTLSNPFGDSFGSLAAGDLNHDGFVDLFVANQNGYNNPSNTPDQLYLNNGNDNHYLAVNLIGTESNKNAVGARIEIHGSWGIQVREVRAGESYGITNSLTSYFGLGDETAIEYVVVHWPSGQTDVVRNVAADQFLTIEEGSSCMLGGFELEVSGGDYVLCPGETVAISAPAGFDYLWSNGSASQTLLVDAAGNYSTVIVDADGCAMVSNVVSIMENPDVPPVIEVLGETEFCAGGTTVLVSTSGSSYTWSNGATTDHITVDETGDYFVTVPGLCGDLASQAVHVEVLPAANAPETEDVTIFGPQAVTLQASGNNPQWYDTETATEPIAEGNVFETPEITETTTFWVEDVAEYGGTSFATGMAQQAGNPPYNGDTFNGILVFDVEKAFVLKQVTVTTDAPGIRRIEVWDANDNVLMFKEVDLPVGESTLDLEFLLEPGSGYQLTTNEATNVGTFGTNHLSPRLTRSSSNVAYPYEVAGVVSITGTSSSSTSAYYYYFFDWQVELVPVTCVGERVPVTINVVPNAVHEWVSVGRLAVLPNPSTGQFTLDLLPSASGPAQLHITDLTGQPIFSEKMVLQENVRQRRPIDLGSMPSGMYFLQITSGERASRVKLLVVGK